MTLNALEYDASFITGFQAQTKMPQQLLELIKGVIQASDRELDSSIFKVFLTLRNQESVTKPEKQDPASHTHIYEQALWGSWASQTVTQELSV